MNQLIKAQREAIRYYKGLLKGETNSIKKYLLKKEIERSENELAKMMKPKYPVL